MNMMTKKTGTTDRLSGLDASFLSLERKEIPLHMAGIFVFDRPLPFDSFVRRVDSQLPLIPRYRQIVVPSPLNLGYPTWEDDPNFNITRHILPVRLDAPGGEAELEALSGRILSEVMDRGRPLWDIRVVSGLRDGHGAMIVRIHHAMADGIAGAGLVLRLILDTTRAGSYPVRRIRTPAQCQPGHKASVADNVASGIQSSLGHLIDAVSGAISVGERILRDPGALIGAVGLLPEALGAFERLPLNRACGGDRKFCWAEFDFSRAQAVRAASGGSINDVILTVLTRALARYVQLHRQTIVSRLIRVVCPVNLRHDSGENMGNQLAFMPVALPLDIEDPVRMLQAAAFRTAAMKRIGAAGLLSVVASSFGVAPPPLQALLWRGIGSVILPLPALNIICTNIPGNPEALYCVGRKLLTWYPQVPTGYELGINCAVTRYGTKLCCGLIADAQVAPDVQLLRDLLKASFDEMCIAAGVSTAERRMTGNPRRKVKALVEQPVPQCSRSQSFRYCSSRFSPS
jgi:diacylglycerol O-acyltransferase